MKAGIIAAGTGERFVRKGVLTPKPLLPVGGEPMIARVIRTAARLNVSAVACIVNDLNPGIAEYLRSRPWPVPLEMVVKTTPSSMESLFALAPLLGEDSFVLFTVDAIFPFDTLKSFSHDAMAMRDADGVLALTSYIDDEKPLWANIDSSQKIAGLGQEASQSPYATAGFYFFRPSIFREVDAARARGLAALRHFLALLIEKGYSVYGIPVAKTVDVDTPEDIEKAEAYLKEIGQKG